MDRSIKPPSPAETRIFDQLRAAAGNLLNFANDLSGVQMPGYTEVTLRYG
jgi:hypothetical protein